MTDLSITDLLYAYGAWCNDDQNELSCKSPSQILIKVAPHKCKNDSVKPSNRSTVGFITDEQALTIDRAMVDLKTHSVHLFNIVALHFVYNWSERKLARDYLSKHKTLCDTDKPTVYHSKPLLNQGVGFISGVLANKA